jgi:hypothetical protein
MLREIRIYWRLRPFIEQLKGEFHMKLSWNVVIQIIGTIVQALNAVGGLLPVKNQVLIASVVGVLQALTALFSHFSNPDGSPAEVAYKPSGSVKLPMALLCCIVGVGMFLPVPARAQEPPIQNIVGGGVYFDQFSTPQIGGNLFYAQALSVTQGTYSFTLIDFTSKTVKPFTLMTTTSTGILQHMRDFGPVRIYGVGTIGVSAGGSNAGLAYTGGGVAVIPLGRNWFLLPNLRILKSAVSEFQGVYGLAVGFGAK